MDQPRVFVPLEYIPFVKSPENEWEGRASVPLEFFSTPLRVRLVKVGLEAVAMLCGREKVISEVLSVNTTWLEVPRSCFHFITPPVEEYKVLGVTVGALVGRVKVVLGEVAPA